MDFNIRVHRDPKHPGYVLLSEADWGKVLIGLSHGNKVNFLDPMPQETEVVQAQQVTERSDDVR